MVDSHHRGLLTGPRSRGRWQPCVCCWRWRSSSRGGWTTMCRPTGWRRRCWWWVPRCIMARWCLRWRPPARTTWPGSLNCSRAVRTRPLPYGSCGSRWWASPSWQAGCSCGWWRLPIARWQGGSLHRHHARHLSKRLQYHNAPVTDTLSRAISSQHSGYRSWRKASLARWFAQKRG